MRRVATAIGAAVLLMGSGVAFADQGGEKPNKPDKVKECNDGLDNDRDLLADEDDPDCGSRNDNNEGPDDDGEGGPPPGTPDLAQAIQDFLDSLPPGDGGGDPDPAGQLEAVVAEVVDQLPLPLPPPLPPLPPPTGGVPTLP